MLQGNLPVKMVKSGDADIVVVGSCNMDHITYSPRLPEAGETLHGTKYITGNGGKGANQCVAAAKLGAKTAMIGKVGKDADGESFIEKFKSVQINVNNVTQTDQSFTGIASITVDDCGRNSIVIVAGANLLLQPSDINSEKEFWQDTKVLICQNEIPLHTTLEALKVAKSHNVKTIFNPAPAPQNDLDPQFFTLSHILCCNECEAFSLTGIKIEDEESAKKAAIALVNKGCDIGMVTMGANGCVYQEKGSSLPQHVMPKKVNPVDTTGAGDAFVGSLAYFIVKFPTLSLFEQVSRACHVASMSVCKKGTQSSYPEAEELPSFIFSSKNEYIQ